MSGNEVLDRKESSRVGASDEEHFTGLPTDLHNDVDKHFDFEDLKRLRLVSKRLSDYYSSVAKHRARLLIDSHARTLLRFLEADDDSFEQLTNDHYLRDAFLLAIIRAKRCHFLVSIDGLHTIQSFVTSLKKLTKFVAPTIALITAHSHARRMTKNWWLIDADLLKEIEKEKPKIIITIGIARHPVSEHDRKVAAEISSIITNEIIPVIQASHLFSIELNLSLEFVEPDLNLQHIAGFAVDPRLAHLLGERSKSAASFKGTLLVPELKEDETIDSYHTILPQATGILWATRPSRFTDGSVEVLQKFENLQSLHIRVHGQEVVNYSSLSNLTNLAIENLRQAGWIGQITLPPKLARLTIRTLHPSSVSRHPSDCSIDKLLELLGPVSRSLVQLTLIGVRLSDSASADESNRKLLPLLSDKLQCVTLFRVECAIGLGVPHHSLTSLDVRHLKHYSSAPEHATPHGTHATSSRHSTQLATHESSHGQSTHHPETEHVLRLGAFCGPIARLQNWPVDHLRILRIEGPDASVDSLAQYRSLEELELSAQHLSERAEKLVYQSEGILKVLPHSLKLLSVIGKPIRRTTLWHIHKLSRLQELSLFGSWIIAEDLPGSLIMIALSRKTYDTLMEMLQQSGRLDSSSSHHLVVRYQYSRFQGDTGCFALNEDIQRGATPKPCNDRDPINLYQALRRLDLPERRYQWLHEHNKAHASDTAYHHSS